MAEAAATYPAGMSVTRTTPPAAPPYAYALALMGAQDKYRTDLSNWSRANAYAGGIGVPRGTNPRGSEPVSVMHDATPPPPMMAPPKSTLERAQERAQLLKLKAAENGPRLHYTGASYGAPWMAGILTDDPQGMNAYERQFYLPQDSRFEAGGLSNTEQLVGNAQRAQMSLAESRAAEAAARAREAEAIRDAAIARARYGAR